MRFFFDTEFIDDGRTIELLAVGIVAEDGRTYYAEPAEANRSRADEWVRANVIPHMHGPIKPRSVIAKEIAEFVGGTPEFWADYSAYDWVALVQLYGRLLDIPDGWPWFCRDVQQARNGYLGKLPDFAGVAHNALDDARTTKLRYEFLHGRSSERSAPKTGA